MAHALLLVSHASWHPEPIDLTPVALGSELAGRAELGVSEPEAVSLVLGQNEQMPSNGSGLVMMGESGGPGHNIVAAVLVRDGEVLLCHRSPDRDWYPNVWDLPGGHIEEGETPRDALIRELQEELGIGVASESVQFLQDCVLSGSVLVSVWIVTEWHGAATNQSPTEHDAVRWFHACALPLNGLADPYVETCCAEAVRILGE